MCIRDRLNRFQLRGGVTIREKKGEGENDDGQRLDFEEKQKGQRAVPCLPEAFISRIFDGVMTQYSQEEISTQPYTPDDAEQRDEYRAERIAMGEEGIDGS